LYGINFAKVHEAEAANLMQFPTGDDALEFWYYHLGHLNVKSVNTLQNVVSGMKFDKCFCSISLLLCEACIKGKQHRVAFPNKGGRRATEPLEIIHSDVCGPMRTTFMGGARYFVIFIDDFSWHVWLYVLKFKWNCFEKFKEFKGFVETRSEQKKIFWSDNDGEFISKAFNQFF
jgi:hypothetical protein